MSALQFFIIKFSAMTIMAQSAPVLVCGVLRKQQQQLREQILKIKQSLNTMQHRL